MCASTQEEEWLVGNGKREIAPQQEMPGTKWEMGNGKMDVDLWNKQKWEMGNGKWPSGKLDVLELPAFGKRETGNWLLNLPRRDILKNTVEGFRSIKTEPF